MGIGACLTTWAKIAEAGLRDLGVHTEMMADAYYEMWKKGCISGAKKELDRKKMVCSFALGSQELYEFMDHNPMIAIYSVDYTNNPNVIAQLSNVISINGCLEIDFYGQVASKCRGQGR